jgi:hypothetical protein
MWQTHGVKKSVDVVASFYGELLPNIFLAYLTFFKKIK